MKKLILLLACIIILSSFVSANIVVKDSYTVSAADFTCFDNENYCYGSFNSTNTYTTALISMMFKKVGTPVGNLELQLWTADANREPDTLITTSSTKYTSATTTTTSTWYNFTLSDNVAITNGNSYSLVLYGITQNGANHFEIRRGGGGVADGELGQSQDAVTWTPQLNGYKFDYRVYNYTISASDTTPPTLSNARCTSCIAGTNTSTDSTPTINLTCVDAGGNGCLGRLSNGSTTSFDTMTSLRNCTAGSGTDIVCTLVSADQFTTEKTYTLCGVASDTLGNNHSTCNITMNITYVIPFLQLNGLAQNRTYEYQTTAEITGVTATNLVTIHDNTFRYSNVALPFNYTINLLRNNKFNLNDLSATNSTYALIDNKTDLYNASFNISSSGNTNLSINYSGTVIRFPTSLIGNKMYQNIFLYRGVPYLNYNFSFVSASSQTFYVNFSNQGDLNRHGYLNFTMKAFDLDNGNVFDYQENFTNSNHINLSSLKNVSSPQYIYDDFENNLTISNYDVSDCPNDDPYITTDNPDNYLEMYINIPPTLDGYCKVVFDEMILDNSSLLNFTLRQSVSYTPGYPRGASKTHSIWITDGSINKGIYSDYTAYGSSSPYSSNYVYNFIATKNGTFWYLYRNKTSVGYADTQGMSSPLKLYFYMSGAISEGGNKINVGTYIYNMQKSGIGLKRNNGTYQTNVQYGTFESSTLKNAVDNVARVYLDYTAYVPSGTTVNSYVSNNNGSSYESIVNHNFHTFTTSGKGVKVKFVLNSTDNLTTPFISDYRLRIIPSSLTDLFIDIGNDGVLDMTYSGVLNLSNTPINYTGNDSGFNEYIKDNCQSTDICSVPVTLSTGSGGILEVSNFNLTENINPISMNVSRIQNLNNISIKANDNKKTITFSDLRLDYKGSKNITVSSGDLNLTIKVKYSPFDISYPSGQSYWQIFPTKRNQSNIQPYGQNSSTGIWKITTSAYDGNVDVYSKYNESIDSCVTKMEFRGQNFTRSSLNNISTLNITNLTTSNQKLLEHLNTSNSGNIRTYTMINCSGYSGKFIIPYFCFSSICSDCVKTNDWESNCQEVE